MTILNIAEKPSVTKSISKVLSSNCSSTKGTHKYCQNIRFDHESPMIFTSVLGHLFNSDFENSKRWNESDPYDLLVSKIIKSLNKDATTIAENLKRLGRECQSIVVWADCDREGENIAMEIESLFNGRPVLRARFSGISKTEIENALENLCEINYKEAEAFEARIELDLRIGSAFTRIQTLNNEKKKVLNFGPCQIPTLNFVVQRHNLIEGFISENMFSLENTVIKDTNSLKNTKNEKISNTFSWVRTNIFNKNCAIYFYTILHSGKAVITNKTIENKEKYRPLPFRTVEFQKACSSYFKMSGQKLMEVAEKLYNNGYISYPRTETDAFAKNFNYTTFINKLKEDERVGRNAEDFTFKYPRVGKNNDQAHSTI
jgi:DNA topoisomerase-3